MQRGYRRGGGVGGETRSVTKQRCSADNCSTIHACFPVYTFLWETRGNGHIFPLVQKLWGKSNTSDGDHFNLFLTDFNCWGIKFIRLWHAHDQQTKFCTKQCPWWLLYELGKHCSDFIQENTWRLTLRDGPLKKWWGGGGKGGKKNSRKGKCSKIENSSKVKPTERKKSCKGQNCCFTLKPEWIPFANNNSICRGHTCSSFMTSRIKGKDKICSVKVYGSPCTNNA